MFDIGDGLFTNAFVLSNGSVLKFYFTLKDGKTGGPGNSETIFIYTTWRND